MSTSYFGFIALTGGGAGALDKLDGAILVNEDYANGVVGVYNYVYQLIAASGATPDGENVIIPITNPGTKRWLLRNKSSSVNTGDAASLPIGGGTLTGDLNVGTTSAGHNVALRATEGSEMCPALEAVNWTCTNGWSAGSGNLIRVNNASTGTATPSGTFDVVAGKTYKVTMTVSAVSGVITYHIGSSLGRQLTTTTFTDYINAITTGKMVFTGIAGTTCTVTALSIKELTTATGDLRVYGRTIVGSGVWSDNDSKAIDILPQGDIGVRGIRYNLTPNDQEFAEGKTYWDSIWKTLNVQTTTDITLPVGQTDLRRVYNNTGSILYKGKTVYSNGIHADGDSSTVTVVLARANSDTTSDVLGVTTQDIPIASYGFVTVRGNINNIDTTVITASAGDILYLSAATAGELVNTIPVAPNLEVRIGRLIIDDATTGRINVRISQAYKLNDLVDVAAPSPSAGQLLKFDGVSWVASDTSTVAGAGTVNLFLTDQDIPIEGMTRAAACVVTWTAHGLATGAYVQMIEITQAEWTALNWTLATPLFHQVTYLSDNTFSIPVNTSGYAADYNATVDPGTISSGKLQDTPNVSIVTQTDYAQSTGSVEVLIDTYTSYILNRTTIDSGLWEFHTWCYASSITNVNTIVIRVYKRNTAGTETQLFSVETSDLGTASIESIIPSPQPAYTILTTDYLVIKYFAKSDRGVGNYRTLYITHNGSTVYSYIRTPITVLHDELAGLNIGPYSHLSAIEKASAIRNATAAQDGKMTAAYATKLDGIEKASVAEDLAGINDAKFVTPLGLASGNGATLPVTPYKGQLFLHTPTGRNILFQYIGGVWYPQESFGAITIYVHSTGTDDLEHGTATGTSAFKTITYAYSILPYLTGDKVTINLSGESFTENLSFTPRATNVEFVGTTSVAYSGTATGGANGSGATPISVTGTFTANVYNHKMIKFTSGANTGYIRPVGLTTTTTLYVVGAALPATPGNGDTYQILSLDTTLVGTIRCTHYENQLARGSSGITVFSTINVNSVGAENMVYANYSLMMLVNSVFTDTNATYAIAADNSSWIAFAASVYVSTSTSTVVGFEADWLGQIDLYNSIIVGKDGTTGIGIKTTSGGKISIETNEIKGWLIGTKSISGGYVNSFDGGVTSFFHGNGTALQVDLNGVMDILPSSASIIYGTKLDGTADANTNNYINNTIATAAEITTGTAAKNVTADQLALSSPTFLELTTNAAEVTTTLYNKYIPIISDSAGVFIRRMTYAYTGSYVASAGVGIGNGAIQYNTGLSPYVFGINSGQYNIGNYLTAFGSLAGQCNIGNNCTGIGNSVLKNNQGVSISTLGMQSGLYNVGATCSGLGAYSIYRNNWDDVIAIGEQSTSSGFIQDAATDQTFTDAEVTPGVITFAGAHGFGTTGKMVNLYFTTTAGTPPTGLVTTSRYQFSITSSTIMTYATDAAKAITVGIGGTPITIDTATAVSNVGGKLTITSATHGFSNGYNLYYLNGGGTSIGGLTTATHYFVTNQSANTFELEATYGGGSINYESAGIGAAHTFTFCGSQDFAGKLTNSVNIIDSISIGNRVNATKAHQVILGSSTITETALRGHITLLDTPDIVSSAGAISILTAITHVVTDGVGTVLTLANGVEGQQKIIVLKTLTSAGHSDVITPAGGGMGFTTITMAALGATVTLLYTNSKWATISAINVTTA